MRDTCHGYVRFLKRTMYAPPGRDDAQLDLIPPTSRQDQCQAIERDDHMRSNGGRLLR